jgi:hypothetical protein
MYIFFKLCLANLYGVEVLPESISLQQLTSDTSIGGVYQHIEFLGRKTHESDQLMAKNYFILDK